jgi:hypothetical protein
MYSLNFGLTALSSVARDGIIDMQIAAHPWSAAANGYTALLDTDTIRRLRLRADFCPIA